LATVLMTAGIIALAVPGSSAFAGEFEILQEHAAQRERERVLRRMFERTGKLEDAQKEFIEAFKRATFGTDEKRLGAQLDRFVDQHQEIFLAAPDPDLWGNAQKIWPDHSTWLGDRAATDLTAAVRTSYHLLLGHGA